jgi:hypothetical protein
MFLGAPLRLKNLPKNSPIFPAIIPFFFKCSSLPLLGVAVLPVRAKRGVSEQKAILTTILMTLIGGVLFYSAVQSYFSNSGEVIFVSAELYKSTDGTCVFTCAVKNAGAKPAKEVTVKLAEEQPAAVPGVSEVSPLEPGQSATLVLSTGSGLVNDYVAGETYIVSVHAVFLDGSAFAKTSNVVCRGGGKPLPQAFEFAVGVEPEGGSAPQGGSVEATVTVSLISGTPSTVSLSAAGLPQGASASFTPSHGTPPFESTMRISIGSLTPVGTYIVEIRARSGIVTETAQFQLTVTEGAKGSVEVVFSAEGVGSDNDGIILYVDGELYANLPQAFSWQVGSEHSFEWVSPVGTQTWGKRYVWASTSGLSTAKSGSIIVPPGGGSVSATYKTQYLLTVSVNPSGAGSVSANTSSSDWFYDDGASVTLTAYPATGYAFDSWIGSGIGSYSGKANPATVTLNAPITQTANFIQAFTLSVNPTRTTVLPGGGDWTTLTVSNVGSNPLTVTLSASGLPQGASVSFNTNPLTVPPRSQASCTVTVTTSADTPVGSYAITIAGSTGALERTTVYSLIVIEQGGVLVLLQGQDFCFGFTACQSAQWVDQNAGQTYTLPLNYYLDYAAIDSPTGDAQQNSAVVYVWGHDFIFAFASESFVYRPSTSEVVGAETSDNVFQTLLAQTSEAIGSPTGPTQQSSAVVYLWQTDFVYGWGEQTYTYRYSSSEQTGSETSANINPTLNAPSPEAVNSPTGPAQQNNAVVYLWQADFVYGWGEQTYTYRSSSSEQTGPETSANINPTLSTPSSDVRGSPTGPAQQNNAVVYLWGHDFVYGWGDVPFTYRPSASEVAGSETSTNISSNLGVPPPDALQG